MINKILFSFLLLFIAFPGFTIAQNEDDNDSIDLGKGWEPGYIVLEAQKDTVHGFIKINKEKIGYIKSVKFKKDKDSEMLKFGKQGLNWKYRETLRFFGSKGDRYRFINWVDKEYKPNFFQGELRVKDWVKWEEEGAINISLGFYMIGTSNGMVPLPVYCIKKDTLPLAFIFSKGYAFLSTDVGDQKINKSAKQYFISFIADDEELAKEINNGKEMLFSEVLNYVKRYNSRASNRLSNETEN